MNTVAFAVGLTVVGIGVVVGPPEGALVELVGVEVWTVVAVVATMVVVVFAEDVPPEVFATVVEVRRFFVVVVTVDRFITEEAVFEALAVCADDEGTAIVAERTVKTLSAAATNPRRDEVVCGRANLGKSIL